MFFAGRGVPMDVKLIWLFVVLLVYWAFCIFYGLKGAVNARATQSYFLADRRLSPNIFGLASSAALLTAVFIVGHAGMIYRDGIPYSLMSLCAIAMPVAGALFMKRQWMLSRRFGYVTPGEMLSHYFESNLIRTLVLVVALLFTVPFFAVQLSVGGWLLETLSNGLITRPLGAGLLAVIIAAYAALGGLRGIAEMNAIHGLLILAVIVMLGLIAGYLAGGIDNLNQALRTLARIDPDYVNLARDIPLLAPADTGKVYTWSSILLVGFVVAFMGITLAPGISMMSFASATSTAFGKQQLTMFSIVTGIVLIVFSTIQGVAGHLLGADVAFIRAQPGLVNALMVQGLGGEDLLNIEGQPDMFIAQLLLVVQNAVPWLAVALLIGVLAGVHAGAIFVFAAGAIVVRDGIAPLVKNNFNYTRQRFYTRVSVFAVAVAALLFSLIQHGSVIAVTAFAGAYALQLLPALAALCWWSWITRPGCIAGIVAGIIGVTVTDPIGIQWLGILAWDGWPGSIHSAVWGISFNLMATVLVSTLSRNRIQTAHRLVFHRFLHDHAGLTPSKKPLRFAAWIPVLTWLFFAVGPGAVVGNRLWRIAETFPAWLSALPSLWLWQVLWWVFGVYMIWFLAYRMELSAAPRRKIVPLCDDVRDLS